MELAQMDQWLSAAIKELDGQPRGENFRQFLEGNAEGYAFAEKMGAERPLVHEP
ncbi:hypothetical protein FHT78_001365 [Rhizobium sp. BK196]|uniref:hypothetical protein n=1 Tax=Rhizobium sp. BK196 TaxID=2587073 RepID=UPI001610ED35|nr:hypothetical protein [Rhizobium sp. BK196]MBB3309622.1 hypothetical protein [Rhizobium sp. BK196]